MPSYKPTPQLGAIYKHFTSQEAVKASGGRLRAPLTPEAAAGLLANFIVETGSPGLNPLDVVERGNNNAGRGLSQYTGPRRDAYDLARKEAIKQGIDPNTPQWQLGYFWREYKGDFDKMAGGSLIGWTRTFENIPKNLNPAQYAKYFQDKYFRPGTPHTERRMQTAKELHQYVKSNGPKPSSGRPEWMNKLGIPEIKPTR